MILEYALLLIAVFIYAVSMSIVFGEFVVFIIEFLLLAPLFVILGIIEKFKRKKDED